MGRVEVLPIPTTENPEYRKLNIKEIFFKREILHGGDIE